MPIGGGIGANDSCLAVGHLASGMSRANSCERLIDGFIHPVSITVRVLLTLIDVRAVCFRRIYPPRDNISMVTFRAAYEWPAAEFRVGVSVGNGQTRMLADLRVRLR
jgi:hypothetical protein